MINFFISDYMKVNFIFRCIKLKVILKLCILFLIEKLLLYDKLLKKIEMICLYCIVFNT